MQAFLYVLCSWWAEPVANILVLQEMVHGHASFHLGGAWKQGPAKQPEAEQPKALDNLAAAKQREAGQDIAAAKQPEASQDIAAKQPLVRSMVRSTQLSMQLN